MAPNMNKGKQSSDPEETPDIMPERTLTGKEAEEDYQKQLDLLVEQNKEYEETQKKQSSSSSTQNTKRRT
ncbi:hypothetical protein IL306_003292 [Fusarium sp. DS 682]|nr:hypothetical protein IL306_003292 [Fusarium sp. DS 682]